MATISELSCDGMITRQDFEDLPEPAPGWVWELRNGHLELRHMPVSYWHSMIIIMLLNDYWRNHGYRVATESYVGESGFVRGGTGRHCYVADGVVFRKGYRPRLSDATHDPGNLHVVIEAISPGREANDTVHKLKVYAELGIEHYWIVQEIEGAEEVDGVVSMYELKDGQYTLTAKKLASELVAE